MHQVAREHGVVLAAAEGEGSMAGRVTGRRQDAGVVADLVVAADDLGLFRLDDRQHAVAKRRHRRFRVYLGPVIELGLAEHVACLRKSRHPAAVFQPRVPADMVDMQVGTHDVVDVADGNPGSSQGARVGVVGLHVPFRTLRPRVPADVVDVQMRAHYEVDVVNGKAGAGEPAQIGIIRLHVPFRPLRPRLVVADAAIDQDGVVRRLHHIGLEAQDQHVLVVERAGLLHPRPVLRQHFRRQARQHFQRRQEGGFLFDNTVNGEVAGGEFEAHDLPAELSRVVVPDIRDDEVGEDVERGLTLPAAAIKP